MTLSNKEIAKNYRALNHIFWIMVPYWVSFVMKTVYWSFFRIKVGIWFWQYRIFANFLDIFIDLPPQYGLMCKSFHEMSYGKDTNWIKRPKISRIWWANTNIGNRVPPGRNISVLWRTKKDPWRFDAVCVVPWSIPYKIYQKQIQTQENSLIIAIILT